MRSPPPAATPRSATPRSAPASAPRAWSRFARSRSGVIGAALAAAVLAGAAGAEFLAPYAPDARDPAITSATPPSWRHWLGCDADQKDVLSRLLHGSRLSLAAGATSILLALVLGVTTGAVAGYFGGWIDALLMRAVDVALAFPSILLALLAATAFSPGWLAVILAVGLINVPVFARQIRVGVLTLRELEYAQASRAFGAGPGHMLWRVILPGLVGPILVLATLGLGSAILEVAGLSFLGVGGDPTEAEWGKMLSQAKDHLRANPFFALAPAAAISLTILAFNLLGDGLRDALEPRLPDARR